MSKSSVPILMYHALTEAPEAGVHAVHILYKDFEEQMRWLVAEGFEALPLPQAVEALGAGRSLPAKSVVLTFDDGYLSLYRRAMPLLKELGFTATLFVTTDPVGQPSYGSVPGFAYEGQPQAERPLTWDELREMAEAGWVIEAHSCSHPKLSKLDNEKQRHELADCKRAIEEHLNRPVRYYAYPFGDYNRQTLVLMRETGYRGACSVHVGKAPPGGNPFRLPRIEINTGDNLDSFKRKVETGYASDREKLRSRLRDLLYASPAVKDLIKAAAR